MLAVTARSRKRKLEVAKASQGAEVKGEDGGIVDDNDVLG